MKKYLFIACCLFGSPGSKAQISPFVRQLDSIIEALHGSDQFNGTVLYAEHGRILYKKALGVTDFRTGERLKTSSAFNLASVSKQFFGMAFLILSEQGKIGLDDEVKKYIPELPYDGIHIRQLLTHTSGLPEYFDLFQQFRRTTDTLTNEGLVQLLVRLKAPPVFLPGQQWKYCNTNYVLLSCILERVTHLAASAFLEQSIFRPLGLRNTYLYHINMPVVPANHVYGFRQDNQIRSLSDLTPVDGVTGDGNIYSSVEDLFTWEQSLYTEKLVKKATLDQAFQPVRLTDGSTYPYGFGWNISKPGEIYDHTGSWNGFRNSICRDVKNRRTLIVLTSGAIPPAFAIPLFQGLAVTLPATRLITHVRLIDGTGVPARNTSVRIRGDRILAVSQELSAFPGEPVTDGGGMVLAPGFIDTHSHMEGSLQQYPEALGDLSQGVTTIVAGQDGESDPMDSLQKKILARPPAINVASYTGHTTLREAVLGNSQLSRPASDSEITRMKGALQEELRKGSLGLSTGLEYAGAYFSSRHEVLELAKAAAACKGRYISHMRSEDINFQEALEEIIAIGREAKIPVQISHFKIALKDDWGSANLVLSRLEAARQQGVDITADCYPYDYWSSTLRVLFPKTDYSNPLSASFAVEHTFDPAHSYLSRFKPNQAYVLKSITEISALRHETIPVTLMGLISEAEQYEKKNPDSSGVETIMAKSMLEDDVMQFLSWANTNICSDGSNGGHPRGYGSFTRVLGRYVRQQKIMSLETAIHKMTALAAEHVGLSMRGVVAPGYYADLVLFDPGQVQDLADIHNSKALSEGILKVWVNGGLVYSDKKPTGLYTGMLLLREQH